VSMKSREILNRLIEEVRINEGLRVANNRLHDEMYDLRMKANQAPTLAQHQITDVARLLLLDNEDFANKKIAWIKETRALTSCGLKEAKDGVEQALQQHSIDALRNKLTGGYQEDNEPPF